MYGFIAGMGMMAGGGLYLTTQLMENIENKTEYLKKDIAKTVVAGIIMTSGLCLSTWGAIKKNKLEKELNGK